MNKKPLLRGDAVFWIHRVLDEKTAHMKSLAEDIAVLNHQAQNFHKMREKVQNTVLDDLNREFEHLLWDYRFDK